MDFAPAQEREPLADKRIKKDEEQAMSGATCKGDWLLGSACGECDRCKEYALDGARRLQVAVRELRAQAPSQVELDALWTWHHEQELISAGKGEYDDAKWHKARAAVYWRSPLKG